MSQTVTPQDMERWRAAMRTALVPAFQQASAAMRQMHTALQPLIEQIQEHPELTGRWQRQLEAEPGSCNCLCPMHRTHGENVCRGEAQPGLSYTFHSSIVGQTQVPMCRPCHTATVERVTEAALRRAADPLAYSPDAMAVSFDKGDAKSR